MDLAALIRQDNERERAAVRSFVETAIAGDVEGFVESAVEVANLWACEKAMRAISRASPMPRTTRECFLGMWVRWGDSFRNQMTDDKALITGLRALLPPYSGPAVQLYRGDSFFNRKRRTYGLSWSSKIEVAESFAQGIWQTFDGGSVVVETLASPVAIVCAPHLTDNSYEEDEYVVDRRRLDRVRVVARFPQKPI
jgi:hypothetical protein